MHKIMEELMDKFSDLKQNIDTLEDNEVFRFNTEHEYLLNKLNSTIDNLTVCSQKFLISKEKTNEIELENKRNKIINLLIFPYYWKISEYIYNLNEKELDATNITKHAQSIL